MSDTHNNFLESVKFYQASIKCCFQVIKRSSGDLSLNYDVCPHSKENFSWSNKSTIQLSISDISLFTAHTMDYLPENEDVVISGHGADNKTSLIIKKNKNKNSTYINYWVNGSQLCFYELTKPEMFTVLNLCLKILKEAHGTTQNELLGLLKQFYGCTS